MPATIQSLLPYAVADPCRIRHTQQYTIVALPHRCIAILLGYEGYTSAFRLEGKEVYGMRRKGRRRMSLLGMASSSRSYAGDRCCTDSKKAPG